MFHRLRQGQPSQKVAQVVSQYEQCEPHLVGHEFVAGKPGPVQGVLALLDPLLRRATAIVEADYAFGWLAQVGHDETNPGEQLPLVPLHLGHHSPG